MRRRRCSREADALSERRTMSTAWLRSASASSSPSSPGRPPGLPSRLGAVISGRYLGPPWARQCRASVSISASVTSTPCTRTARGASIGYAKLAALCGRLEVARREHLLEGDQVKRGVGDLDPHVRLARYGRLDADAASLQ